MPSARVLLAIAGNIGSGKTTLTRLMSHELGFQPMFEPSDENPYLDDFYRDMPRYALPLQLRFLAARVAQVRALVAEGVSAIQDRTCYEDVEIFARNLRDAGSMDERDFETYSLVARELVSELPAPELLIYLHRSPSSCARAVTKRGRDYESSLPAGYLEGLGARYDRWFEEYDRGPKLRLEGSRFDVIDRPADLRVILTEVRAALPQRMIRF